MDDDEFEGVLADLETHAQLRRVSYGTPAGPVSAVAPPVVIKDDAGAEVERSFGPVPAPGEQNEAIREEFAAR